MSDLKALAEERTQLFTDVIDGKIPKRVPININFPNEFALQYAGMDLTTAQWDTRRYLEAFDKLCQDFYTDSYPLSALKFPSVYKQLDARNFVMGSNGFIQHPEVEGMAVEDYESFIASPYDCIVERILPRLYPALDAEPTKKAMTLAKAFKAWFDEMANLGMVTPLVIKMGMPPFPPSKHSSQ